MASPAPSLLVHYQELALKGRNRPWFVDRLVSNLREVTAGLGVAEVRAIMGRVELRLRPGAAVEPVLHRVERTLGVATVAVAHRAEPTVEAIIATALDLVSGREAESFRVAATRADKSFRPSSPELERVVGSHLQDATGWMVNLSNPRFVVWIDVRPGGAYVSVERRRGPAGLPVGVSGRVACLLSGGIDSPVAAYRLMRRGCRVVFVHFHAYPITSDVSKRKARHLARILAAFQLRSRLVLVPFGDVQRRVVVETPAPLRVVIYRRFMLRIAERIARGTRARALVTGEAIGQVASQTLENLASIDAAASMPVLRPLIGHDKEDITAEARAIGTYGVSIEPDDDCCQLYAPRHPAINVGHEEIARVEERLPIAELIHEAVAGLEREEYSYADAVSPTAS